MAAEPIITVVPESVTEEPAEKQTSKKREITAAVTAGVVVLLLGAASGKLIERIGEGVKNKIAPKPESETE